MITRKTILSFIIIILFAIPAKAVDHPAISISYYFSDISGDDSRTSAQAQNPATPWKTTTKFNSFFPSLLPGDQVLFKRGETFYGYIVVGRSGTAGLPIIIGAYGTGDAPIITGFTTISGWTNLGGGIYESAATPALLSRLNMVVINGVQYGMGRWPNRTDPDGGFMYFESHTGSWNGASVCTITDAQLTATPNWVGAEVVIKPQLWLLNRAIVTDHSGGTLTLIGDQPIRSGFGGYFIQNDIKTLDQLGEWYYNPSTKKVAMYFGAANPATYTVQAASIDSLLYSTGKSYISVSNITFKGSNCNTISAKGSATDFYIDSCSVLFAGVGAINFSTTTGITFQGAYSNSRVTDCYISDINDNGILGNSSPGIIIRGNTIRNVYMIAGMGGEGDGRGWGARIGNNGLMEYNTFINMGYIGAGFAGSNLTIQNNFFDSFGLVKGDVAAIYSGLTSGYVPYTNRRILNNIILHGMGNIDGSPSTEYSVYGIYFDDNINGVLIEGNTSAYSRNSGLMLHNCLDMIVRGNTFYDNHKSQTLVLDDLSIMESSNLRFASNIYATTGTEQATILFNDNADGIGEFQSSDSNVYANLLGYNTSIYNTINNFARYEYHDLASWRLKHGEDANGAYSQKTIAPYRDLVLVGANKIPSPLNNSTMTNAGESWTGTSAFVATGSGLDGGALQVTPNATAITDVAMSVGTVTAGTPYVVRFSVKAGTYSHQGSFGVRMQVGTSYTPYQYYKIKTTREEVEMLFVPQASGVGGLRFGISEGGTPFYLDNIYLYQATATVTVPEDSILFEYNNTKVDKVVPLTGTYQDVYGTSYTTSVTLAPYTSKILIFMSGALPPIVKTNPTITWGAITAITYETLLSATQLNATASVPGRFVYTPALGALLPAGTHTLSSEFIPDDETNYNRVTTTRNIVVNKAVATLAYSVPTLTQVYTGLPLAPTVITTPTGLTVVNILYDGVATTPITAGVRALSSSLNNANYTASTITGTFTITKASVTITVTSNLTQTADGNPKPVQAVTNPVGKTLTYLYNGSSTPPSAPGTYTVDITVVDANYQGTLQVTLNIVTSSANIFITNLLQTYTGSPLSVTVTSPYSYTVTYNGSTSAPIGVDNYQVIATINDGIHTGADTATFVIQQANLILTWPPPARIFLGTALTSIQLNATSNVEGVFCYSHPEGTILPVGTHIMTATFIPEDEVNYNTMTISVSIAVYADDLLNYYITNGRTIYIKL